MRMLIFIFALLSIVTEASAQYKEDYHENPDGTGIPVEEIERYLRVAHDHNMVEPFFGLPIRWPTYYHDSAIAMGGGMATIVNGQRVVVMSPTWIGNVGPLIAGAVLQHEYCHHDNSYSPISAVREADADCCSAKHMAMAGRVDAITATAQYLEKGGCNYDPNLPIELTPGTHPCGIQRKFIVLKCGGLI